MSSLPSEYVDELNTLNREITTKKPTDVLQFCANYFNARIKERSALGGSASGGANAGSFAFNTHSFSSDPTAPANKDETGSSFGKFNFGAAGPTSGVSGSETGAPAASSRAFPTNFTRRTSVSAESLNPSSFSANSTPDTIPEHTLSNEQLQRLNQSVSRNFLFSSLDEESLHLVLHALEEKRFPKGSTIIKQGDEGDFYYVVEVGSVDFIVDGSKVSSGGSGSSFGELALMYNAPRAATVVATQDTVVWALDRVSFKQILLDKTHKKRTMYGAFLKEVPILKVLNSYELNKLADALESRVYEPGEVIIKEGDIGDEFFIIESGEAVVTKEGEGKVSDLSKGDYFGEVALLHDSPRQASVSAATKLKVATLGRSGFQRLLGPVVDILKRQDPTN